MSLQYQVWTIPQEVHQVQFSPIYLKFVTIKSVVILFLITAESMKKSLIMPSYVLDVGYVMHVIKMQNQRITGKAKMEYFVDQPAALGCQIRYLLSLANDSFLDYIVAQASVFLVFFLTYFLICFSFWYCIYNNALHFSSFLELIMIRDKDEKSLLKISETSITMWKKAKALLGNQRGGYKVSQ